MPIAARVTPVAPVTYLPSRVSVPVIYTWRIRIT
jgi:hypothetical protein